MRIRWCWTATSASMRSLAVLAFVQAAFGAGNVVITGHDDDYHAGGCGSPSQASDQLRAMIAFARSGAPKPSLPVLSFDHGTELTNCLVALGIPNKPIDPDVEVPAAANFNVADYSAMVVASDSSCGGCDNTPVSIANLRAASAAIGAFLNAGGGIVAFAGAMNASTYYGFLPASASGFGSPPPSGYVQTSSAASTGIPEVNGNQTHNFFSNPGAGGVSAAYDVAETLGPSGTAETLVCRNCSTTSLVAGALFEPLAVVLGIGLAGVVLKGLRRRSADGILKGLQPSHEQDRRRAVQERGFDMQLTGNVRGDRHFHYDLEIHGAESAHSRRGQWDV